MAEWSKALALKANKFNKISRVRIPFYPILKIFMSYLFVILVLFANRDFIKSLEWLPRY